MSNVILQGVTLQELNQNLLKGIDERIYDLTNQSKKEPIEYWTRKEIAKKTVYLITYPPRLDEERYP